MNIDFDKLRRDLIDYYEEAYLISGFGAALVESVDVKYASNEELIRMANQYGFNLNNYEINIKTR